MNKLHTKVKRNDESFLVTALGNETVMMNLINGDFIGLNSVASEIWNFIKEPISVEGLIRKLTEKYEVDETICKAETIAYLEKMLKEKMVIRITE